MIQKVIKVGNSLAVTLPADYAKKSKIKAGDKVYVETDNTKKMMLIKDQSERYTTGLTPEFFSWLEKTTKKYEKTIKELAAK